MQKHSEKDYIVPTLFVIYDHNGDCTTEIIKEEVSKYITLNDEDLKPLPSRNQKEPGYYQIVGNLISHKNQRLLNYINLIIPEDEREKKNPKYIWTLNSQGKKYVEEILLSAKEAPNEEVHKNSGSLDPIDNKIVEYAKKNHFNKRPPTDVKMSKTILEINNYKCKYAQLIGERHNMFDSKNGHPYVEAHHLIPMKASKDFFPKSLDRPSNIVCLCPMCHARLHHGSKNEKQKILSELYNHYILGLNDDDIYISFDNLFEKYYK